MHIKSNKRMQILQWVTKGEWFAWEFKMCSTFSTVDTGKALYYEAHLMYLSPLTNSKR